MLHLLSWPLVVPHRLVFANSWPVHPAIKLILQVQMDMHVMAPSGGFDEGADAAQWQHWAPT